MAAGERLPQHHSDCPHVGSRRRLASGEPLGGDVRQRSRHVAGLGQRLGVGHLREPEVEDARRYAIAVGEEDVRRLDVAVEDPGGMRVGQAVAHLRARLDRSLVLQLPGPQRLAVGAAGDEFVRDVDVPRVAAEAPCTEAGGVAQLRCGCSLALGSRGRFALAGDDLERDVEPRPFVAGEPDRAGATAAERPQRAVAVEDELDAGERWGGLSHARVEVGDPVGLSFPEPR